MDSLAQLSCWIDPVEVLDALIRVDANEAALGERDTLLLQSKVLDSGSEAGFDRMVAGYLGNFELPYPILILTLAWYHCSAISRRAVAAVAGLRFDGTITSYDRQSVPSHLPPDTVLAIEASNVLIELVKNPCAALLDIVSSNIAFWRQKRDVLKSPYVMGVELTPSAPSPLQIAIESEVASSFGVLTKAADLDVHRMNQGFRAITVSGRPPLPDTLVHMLKEHCRAFADPTAELP